MRSAGRFARRCGSRTSKPRLLICSATCASATSCPGAAAATSSITSCAGVRRSPKGCRARMHCLMCAHCSRRRSSAITPIAIGRRTGAGTRSCARAPIVSSANGTSRASSTARRSACAAHYAPIPPYTRASMPPSKPPARKTSRGACSSACTTSRRSPATSSGANPNATQHCVSSKKSRRAASEPPFAFQRSPSKSAA